MSSDHLQHLIELAHHSGRPVPSGAEIERRAACCRACEHGYQADGQPCDHFPTGLVGSRAWAAVVLFGDWRGSPLPCSPDRYAS
jgi:hypothetical protein